MYQEALTKATCIVSKLSSLKNHHSTHNMTFLPCNGMWDMLLFKSDLGQRIANYVIETYKYLYPVKAVKQ